MMITKLSIMQCVVIHCNN